MRGCFAFERQAIFIIDVAAAGSRPFSTLASPRSAGNLIGLIDRQSHVLVDSMELQDCHVSLFGKAWAGVVLPHTTISRT